MGVMKTSESKWKTQWEDSRRGSPQIGSQESGDEKMKNLEKFLNYSKPKSTLLIRKGCEMKRKFVRQNPKRVEQSGMNVNSGNFWLKNG